MLCGAQGHKAEDAEAFSPQELLRWWTECQLRPGALLAVRVPNFVGMQA